MQEKLSLLTDTSTTLAQVAEKTTYCSLSLGFATWLANVDIIPLLSIILALMTFILNAYFKRIENKRAEEIHKKNMGEKK